MDVTPEFPMLWPGRGCPPGCTIPNSDGILSSTKGPQHDHLREQHGFLTRKEWVEGLSRVRCPNPDREVVRKLEAILVAGDGGTQATESSGSWSPVAAAAAKAGIDLEAAPVTGPHVPCPELTAEKLKYAMAVIPADYWSLNCWSCRGGGYRTYTCPRLTGAQRLYFAYQYYLYQVEANPAMEGYLQQRAEKRRELASAGPGERVRLPERPAVDPTPMGPPRAVMQRGRGRGSGGSRVAPFGRGGYSSRRDRDSRPLYANTGQVFFIAEDPGEGIVEAERSAETAPTWADPGCETEDEYGEALAEN